MQGIGRGIFMLSSGQMASLAGVNVETLRFYERKGLLPAPRRTPGGFRQYTRDDLRRLRFIQTAKRHGFTLSEIKELLDLRVSPESTCAQVQQKAQEKIAVINQKLRELQRMKQALQTLAASCHGSGPAGDCPILEAFELENGSA